MIGYFLRKTKPYLTNRHVFILDINDNIAEGAVFTDYPNSLEFKITKLQIYQGFTNAGPYKTMSFTQHAIASITPELKSLIEKEYQIYKLIEIIEK